MNTWARRPCERGAIPAAMLAAIAVLLAVAGLLWWVARTSSTLPDGPAPIAWNDEVCAHCHMHVGEPGFAAQLQTKDSRVLVFDDPGCLFAYLQVNEPAIHAIWFHHLRQQRWLDRRHVGFIEIEPTPMGYGLGAVDRSEAGAISFEEAQARLARRTHTTPR